MWLGKMEPSKESKDPVNRSDAKLTNTGSAFGVVTIIDSSTSISVRTNEPNRMMINDRMTYLTDEQQILEDLKATNNWRTSPR